MSASSATTVPLSSLLTFPLLDQERTTPGTPKGTTATAPPLESSIKGGASGSRTSQSPPGSHILVTSTYPAPAAFAPLYHARQALRSGHAIVWIACSGCGEAHVQRALRGSAGSDSNRKWQRIPSSYGSLDGGSRIVYLDALDTLMDEGLSSHDARPALLRLKNRITQAVKCLAEDNSAGVESLELLVKPRHVTVIIDDASALAWMIPTLSSDNIASTQTGPSDPHPAVNGTISSKDEDPRIRLLRDKRRQGAAAIHRDEIGERLGTYIAELHGECCESHGATLVTHLGLDCTSVTAPESRSPATRGGQFGVGTGFDADDAGEENEEEELYEDVEADLWQAHGDPDEKISGVTELDALPAQRRAGGVAASHVDWRVDSLLRRLVLHADLWIEIRGLRSGRARDCHGELCIFALSRPCLARGQALPDLPLPADPLASVRAQDRAANPLKNLSRLSLKSAHGSSPSRKAEGLSIRDKTTLRTVESVPLRAWACSSWCEGRDNAMLFRIEPSGDAVAWSRGAARTS